MGIAALGVVLAFVPAAGAATIAPAASGPVGLGLVPGISLTAANDGPAVLARIKTTGATTVRVGVLWCNVAPSAPAAGFNPANPADPQYNWATDDEQMKLIAASGLQAVVTVYCAPSWAEDPGDPGPFPLPGTIRPNATAFGQFMLALATRYSGSFEGLPRVRYWEIWNEPNIHLDINPQLDASGNPVSPGIYRDLVNAGAASLHQVQPDNVVIGGGTAPFRDNGYPGDWGPLTFMRDLLCLSPTLTPTCHDPVHFDVWATNPYTSGGPQHHAQLPDDVSLGDLGKMRSVLVAAAAAGNIVSAGPVGFWLTEFSWDSNPPDPKGVPMAVEARWISEMLYRTWLVGVSNVMWFSLVDYPLSESYIQSGLVFAGTTPAGGNPKPLLEAFRFPVVAFRASSGIMVWGRTPLGQPGSVQIQQSYPGGWKTIARVQSDQYGIFRGRYKTTSQAGSIRARVNGSGEQSLKFSLKPVPDHFYNPFGTSLTG